MSRGRASYPQEFREQIIELYKAGRSIPELAREFERVWFSHLSAPDSEVAEF